MLFLVFIQSEECIAQFPVRLWHRLRVTLNKGAATTCALPSKKREVHPVSPHNAADFNKVIPLCRSSFERSNRAPITPLCSIPSLFLKAFNEILLDNGGERL